MRDETRGAREKHFVISDDEKEEVSVIISRVTGVKAERDTVFGMDEKEGVGRLASLLLTQIINPALLAADFRAKTRGTAIIYPSQSL